MDNVIKHNWYKIAITEKQFYEFYGYIALPQEVFKDNPVAFYTFIEILNSIRDYYLPELIKCIQRELLHASEQSYDGFDYAISKNLFFKYPKYYEGFGQLNLQQWIDKHWEEECEYYGVEVTDTTHCEEAYEEFYGSAQASPLKEVYVNFINDLIFDIDSLTLKDFKLMRELFTELPWDSSYGGELWALVCDWTWELKAIGEIQQVSYNFSTLQKMQKLAMIIDTIHSLEHNTSNILSNLPNGEYAWLSKALDTVELEEEPRDVAKESGNRELIKLYHQYNV